LSSDGSAGRDWLQRDHALMCDAVREAGEIAMEHFRRGTRHWDKQPGDPVSGADLAVDSHLRERLMGARPGYGWLSEEGEEDLARLDAGRTWVVDPIDGTRSFIAGRPTFAVSVALVVEGRPLAGVVHNPASEEFVEAIAGGGVRLNGAPCRVSDTAATEAATLLSSDSELRRNLWRDCFPEAEIVAINAIAYKLALIAAGRYDAVIALKPKSDWDIAAGELLVNEAGGVMTTADGGGFVYNRERPKHPNLIAAGPALVPRLRTRLADKR